MQIPAQIHHAKPEIHLRVSHRQYNTGCRFTVLTHQHHAGINHTSTSGGDLPHELVLPRLGHIGLMKYHRAKQSLLHIEQAIPMMRRLL